MNRWMHTLGTLSRNLLQMHGHLPTPRRTRTDAVPAAEPATAPPHSKRKPSRLRARMHAARREQARNARYYVRGTR